MFDGPPFLRIQLPGVWRVSQVTCKRVKKWSLIFMCNSRYWTPTATRAVTGSIVNSNYRWSLKRSSEGAPWLFKRMLKENYNFLHHRYIFPNCASFFLFFFLINRLKLRKTKISFRLIIRPTPSNMHDRSPSDVQGQLIVIPIRLLSSDAPSSVRVIMSHDRKNFCLNRRSL